MVKYRLNLSFDIDVSADEEEEMSEEEIVDMLQELYYNDRKEFLDALRYYFEKEKKTYSLEIKPQKVYSDDQDILWKKQLFKQLIVIDTTIGK